MDVTDLRRPAMDATDESGGLPDVEARLEVRPGRTRAWVVAAVAAVLAAGLVLRFLTLSHLWLDEALTVNIARLPLGRIPAALRHDGSPPLYYYLLHLWMAEIGRAHV